MNNPLLPIPAIVCESEDLATLASRINAEHAAVERTARTSLEHARAAGEALAKAKKQVGHGNWMKWLKDNVRCSQPTAFRYIKISSGWNKLFTVNNLSITDALRLLSIDEPEPDNPVEVPAAAFDFPDEDDDDDKDDAPPKDKDAEKKERTEKKLSELAEQAKAVSVTGPATWEIINGDCVVVLERLNERPNLIFADPPYNIGLDYGAGTDDSLHDQDYLSWVTRWLTLCSQRLADDGTLWVMINDEYVGEYAVTLKNLGLTLRNWVKWYETFGVNCSNKYNRTSRHLLYCVKDPVSFTFNRDPVSRPSDRQTKYDDPRANPEGKILDDVWTDIPRLAGTHAERLPEFPTQLPVKLLERIVLAHSNPGDLVLDPFSSSATTGTAAVAAGRRYIGIEKNPRFVELSQMRLGAVKS